MNRYQYSEKLKKHGWLVAAQSANGDEIGQKEARAPRRTSNRLFTVRLTAAPGTKVNHAN